MASSPSSDSSEAAQNNVQIAIQRLYVKDVSFEAPNVPELFNEQNYKPEIKMEMNSQAKKLTKDLFEVVLSMTLTAKQGEKTAFLVEVHQAGIFIIQGLEDAQSQQVLGTFCPEALYPYMRETISSLVNRGGFPPVYLAPVNFAALYQAQLQNKANDEGSSAEVTTH